MKKLFLATLLSAAAMTASASVQLPDLFSSYLEDTDMNQLKGWTFSGPEGTPTGDYARFFTKYSASNPIAILGGSVGYGVWTTSEYKNGQESDTWVITPEIDVTVDEAILAYTVEVAGITNQLSSSYSIYVSEGSTAKEDFTLLQSSLISGSSQGAGYVNSSTKKVQFKGYKGKKVRLAFVNKGNKAGIMGFANISLSSWLVSNYPDPSELDIMLINDGSTISIPMRICTPSTIKGAKVDFSTSSGFTYSYEDTSTFRFTTQQLVTIKIPDVKLSEYQTYTLTVTPSFEGAIPLVITGEIVVGSRDYESVPVMEEATGTWCGWCPFGAATLNYYTDEYTGAGNSKKVIGIAIHDYDPMEISSTISDYYSAYMKDMKIPGFPNIMINRSIEITPTGYEPPLTVGNYLNDLLNQKSYSHIKINKIYYDPTVDNSIVADYTLMSGFDGTQVPVSVTAVVKEDHVQGTNMDYNQASYLSGNGVTAATVRMYMGADWVPYLQPYFGVTEVFYTDLQYDHVARAAYPSYFGEKVYGAVKGEPFEGRIRFIMPSNVMVKENTSVVLLVTLPGSREIIAADELAYDAFTFESGVEKVVENSNIRACIEGGKLIVNVDASAQVEVFGIDGKRILSAPASAGENSYALDATGVVIVNVSCPSASRQFKLIL